VPVVHLNVRYLEAGDVAWFGGGTDLTPFRAFPEDTAHFHGVLQQTCGPDRYARFSQWAREYFFLPHRGSERGVGGIFFDYLRGEEEWRFVQQVGDAFLPAYVPIVERRRVTPWTEADRRSQLRFRFAIRLVALGERPEVDGDGSPGAQRARRDGGIVGIHVHGSEQQPRHARSDREQRNPGRAEVFHDLLEVRPVGGVPREVDVAGVRSQHEAEPEPRVAVACAAAAVVAGGNAPD